MSENDKNITEKFHFQAEVSNVLDIVINSLYKNREIFVRELISNASDALEKLRQINLTQKDIFDKELPMDISIELDEKKKIFKIVDTGIGMTRDELLKNLGSIAHSGSKEFLSKLADAVKKDVNLIGQFGVGFYSAFMVSKKVTVQTRSYLPDAQGYEWSSTGSQEYSITPVNGLRRGTTIILELKDGSEDFSKTNTIKQVIQKYSNFVSFPILLNSQKVNIIQAIWTRHKSDIKEEEYNEFYKFVANTVEEPLFCFHFSVDVPIQIYALLFIPKTNFEKFGFKRYESGIDLHCKKILIEKHVDWILPEWMRFAFGVIDSEDLPLNISRETLQETVEVKRLGKIIATRFIKFLDEQTTKEPEKFKDFYKNFGSFIKEGIATDFTHRSELTKIIRFESSKTEPEKLTSLSEYVSRMKPNQKEIYYVNGSSREAIEEGPYLETFLMRDIEVLYTYDAADDIALSHLGEFEGKKLIPADNSDIDLEQFEVVNSKDMPDEEPLGKDSIAELCSWLKKVLEERVEEVRETNRLSKSPAALINTDKMVSSSMQKLFQMMNKDFKNIGRKALEINPKHPIIKKLAAIRKTDEEFAKTVAEQIFDNALISAGLIIDPTSMLNRINTILNKAMK